MRPAHRNAALADLSRNRLRVMARRPRAIEQTLDPRLPITQKPFVARLPAHAELPAERSKRLLVLLGRNHKAHPLIHGAGLRESRDKVLGWSDSTLTGSERTLATAWATSVDRLTPESRRLLDRLAMLAPDPIPDSLLDVAIPGRGCGL